MNLRHL
jgi:hypothetical protein